MGCGRLPQAMQAQNMMWVPALATAFAAIVNIPVNLLLIKYYAFPGAAAAFSVTRVLLFLFLIGEPARSSPAWRTVFSSSSAQHGSFRWLRSAATS